MSSSGENVSKFSGPNGKISFAEWKFRMEVKFAKNNWLFALDRTRRSAPLARRLTTVTSSLGNLIQVEEDEETQLASASANIYYELVNLTVDGPHDLVCSISVGDGIKAWTALKTTYTLTTVQQASRAVVLQQDFLSRRWNDDDTIDSYSAFYLKSVRELKACGSDYVFPNALVKTKILQGLPRRFDMFKETEYSRDFDSFEKLFERLHVFDSNRSVLFGSSTPDRAFVSKSRPQHNTHKNVQCSFCKRFGHTESVCRSKKFSMQQRVNPSIPKNTHAKHKAHRAFATDVRPTEAVSTTTVDSAFVFANSDSVFQSSQKDWILDSAATAHVTPHRSLFINYSTTLDDSSVSGLDNKGLKVEGKGDVLLTVKTLSGISITIQLLNVLHVPKSQVNLLSVARMITSSSGTKTGNTFFDGPSGPKVTLSSGSQLYLQVRKGLTWLEDVSTRNEVVSDFALVAATEMHERLAHLNHHDVLKTAEEAGITLTDKSMSPCDVCILSKSTKKSVDQVAAPRTAGPGELIYTDISVSDTPDVVSSSKYAIVFVDDFSRVCAVYGLKEKSDAHIALKKLVADWSTGVFGFRIVMSSKTVIQSDSESVFKDAVFRDQLAVLGYGQRFSPPHTQAMNGVAERKIGVLTDMARSMIRFADLPSTMWLLAMKHAAFIRNRSYSRSIGSSPIKKLTSAVSDVSMLHVFGQPAYVHVEQELRSKWEDKSRHGIYVGYDCQSSASLVYFRDTRKIVVSYHVDILPFNHSNNNLVSSSTNTSLVDLNLSPNESSSALSSDTRVNHIPDGPVTFTQPTVAQALSSADKDEWLKAINSELSSLEENETWIKVPRSSLSPSTRILPSKFVLKVKHKPDGSVDKFKARLVVCGNLQRDGLDYDEVYAPTVQRTTFRVLCALSAQYHLYMHQMDVVTAFLNPELDEGEVIYMHLPSVLTKDLTHVYLLKKAIYGLKQAPRRWHHCLVTFLNSVNFSKSKADPCLFIRGSILQDAIFVAVYVDDLLIVSSSTSLIDSFKKQIATAFRMTDGGLATFYTGVQIFQDIRGAVSISQSQYVIEILKRFHMNDSKPMSLPLPCDSHYSKDMQSSPLSVDTPYRELLGSLNYASVLTRPDISTAVGMLCKFMQSPQEAHWTAAKHTLRYLNGNRDVSLSYRHSSSPFILQGYSDASYAGDTDSRKSTSGYLFMLGGAAVSWSSKQQTIVATSTMEAELIAAWSAATELIHLRNLLRDLLCSQELPTVLHTDSQPVINSITSGSVTSRTKHVDIKYRSIEEHIKHGHLKLSYLPTADMPADLFTKNLPKEKFSQFRQFICGINQ
jgi:hypothetical protein